MLNACVSWWAYAKGRGGLYESRVLLEVVVREEGMEEGCLAIAYKGRQRSTWMRRRRRAPRMRMPRHVVLQIVGRCGLAVIEKRMGFYRWPS